MIDHTKEFSTGMKIRLLRLEQNITQEKLASIAAIAPKYLSLIETDQREASIHVYRCIAKALDIPVWHLFCDLPDECLLVLHHLEDCSVMEVRALERFVSSNKYALRQHHKQELGLNAIEAPHSQ